MINQPGSFDPERWAAITIQRWEEKITTLGIGHDSILINSFTHQVISDSNGDPALISFAMEYYGRMVDMGVGRGVTLSDVGGNHHRRKPKPWYSKTLAREIHRLAEILAKAYGKKATMLIADTINTESEISIR